MKRNKSNWDMPLLHADHPRPVTRRQLLSQGFITGAAFTVGGIAPLLNPRNAHAQLAQDLRDLRTDPCEISNGAGNTPLVFLRIMPLACSYKAGIILAGGRGGNFRWMEKAPLASCRALSMAVSFNW